MGIPQFIILLAAIVCFPAQDPVRQEKSRAQEQPAPPFRGPNRHDWTMAVPLPHYRGWQPGWVRPAFASALAAPRPTGTPMALAAPVPAMIAPPARKAPVPHAWVPVAFPVPAGEMKIRVPVGQALPPKPAMPW
jgi:hypothetical protein